MKLGEMAKLIRSKNAGPFSMTIDILFDNVEYFKKIKNTNAINSEVISELYKIDKATIDFFTCDPILAIKISFDRTIVAGDIGDTDIFGGQQHGPIVNIEIPNL